MKDPKHSRLALLITILIMVCLLLAGGIFVTLRIRHMPAEEASPLVEDPLTWLGADTVLEILAPDAAEHAPAYAPGMASGAMEGSTASAADRAAADAPAGKAADTQAGGSEASADSADSVDSAEEESDQAQEETQLFARKDPDEVRAAAKQTPVKISRSSLTKTQKKYVESWEETHWRTFPLNAPLHSYNWKHLRYDSHGVLQYDGDENYSVRRGIDVSEFQGKIDWETVRKAGYDFAFIRAGYRMFDSGELRQDSRAIKNLTRAKEAGFDVGVYVFSQAISKDEAREEAALCLKVIEESGVDITLPIVFDPEIQIEYYARINYITAEQFTDNAVAFCEAIEKSGYTPAIYANSSTQTDILNMSRVTDAVIWNADYNAVPESPYMFTFWQYTDYGWVDGIPETETDLNLWFIENSAPEEEDGE